MALRRFLLILIVTSALAAALPVTLKSALYYATPSQDDFVKYAKLSTLAYCPKDKLANFTCKLCDSYAPNFSPVTVASSDSQHVQGYVMVNEATKEIVISFRGTVFTDLKNWAMNIDIIKTQPKAFENMPPNAQVHQGFYKDYIALRDQILQAYESAKQRYPSFSVISTGHSLGGAMATLCGLDLYTKYNEDVKLFTYGSPRVLAPELASWVTSRLTHYRLVNYNDIVPHVPTQTAMNYRHVAQEFWLQKDGTMKVCDMSGEDPNCSLTISLIGTSVTSHLNYFGIAMESEDCAN
eukprot:Colp12_sorted_trinity150504_noHs@6127